MLDKLFQPSGGKSLHPAVQEGVIDWVGVERHLILPKSEIWYHCCVLYY